MKDQSKPIRDLIVLTSQEKRVVVVVMLMVLLGVGVKEYRKRHPPPPIPEVLQKNRGLRRLVEAAGVTPDASTFAPTPRARPTRSSRHKPRPAPPVESPPTSLASESDLDEKTEPEQAPPER